MLIIDDEAPICRAIERVLRAAGFHVATTTESTGAVDLIMRGSFDVILSDVNMPGMNGLQLLEEVARAVPELAPRVVFVTAGVDPQTAEQLERLPNLVLEKPVELGHIRDLVRRRSRLPMPSLADAV